MTQSCTPGTARRRASGIGSSHSAQNSADGASAAWAARALARATASAVLLLIINLIGLGLGPLAVGLLSDILAGPMGLGEAQGVRWALIISAGLGLVAFGLFWAARKTIREEMVS